MAPKPKKELTASEKATLKRLMAGKGALANGKLSMDQKLQLQGLKKKAAAAGKATGQAAPRKALKRPTGELSKSNSNLAKFIKGSASGKDFTKAEARTAAGKFRDIAKATPNFNRGMGYLDRSGVALGKAEAATKAMRKPKPKPKPKSTAAKVAGVAGKVAKRAKTVAREVRDVKTAVGTSLRDQEQNVRRAAMGVKPSGKNVGKNLKTQIKEVGSAIKSGKKGTTSDTYNRPGAYNKGTKRK